VKSSGNPKYMGSSIKCTGTVPNPAFTAGCITDTKKPAEYQRVAFLAGAVYRNRTDDLIITSDVLYQLS
jgi:hypothetical protein